jgi:hypothetical protein
MVSVVAKITLAGLWLLLYACKQPAPAPAPIEHPPVRAENVAPAAAEAEAVPAEQRPVRDPFELDDESDDPAAALESMKHNCCDEMPAEEIRAHTDEGR